MPSGTLWGPHQAFTVEANGQVMNADAYRPLIVTYKNGSPVRLGEGRDRDGQRAGGPELRLVQQHARDHHVSWSRGAARHQHRARWSTGSKL